ncbi:MAG: site-specific DNA-methyltransferase [Streptococcaceae bacterium]|jgi:site-specific DNA-methyltransferase (adenine-specific)|nr:site-specific DNA-methyltransferase [Streptococcaceae bacterium]
MTITTQLLNTFKAQPFTLKKAYGELEEIKPHSLRARIYEALGTTFERIDKGIYQATSDALSTLLIEGNGKDLSFLKDESIDVIITDHPYLDEKAHKGGNRAFGSEHYESFRYTQSDIMEQARVLKQGSFWVQFLPSESATNFDYLYDIKKMAENAGFEYYAKTSWKKGSFVANTGRTAKNSEDILIFSKGKARNLRPNAKANKAHGVDTGYFMSGASFMIPPTFDFAPDAKAERIHPNQKPVSLLEELIKLTTLSNDEVVLDMFAGSGVTGIASHNLKRHSILIEKSKEMVGKVIERFSDLKIGLQVIHYNVVEGLAEIKEETAQLALF